jgi:hypothetical protein
VPLLVDVYLLPRAPLVPLLGAVAGVAAASYARARPAIAEDPQPRVAPLPHADEVRQQHRASLSATRGGWLLHDMLRAGRRHADPDQPTSSHTRAQQDDAAEQHQRNGPTPAHPAFAHCLHKPTIAPRCRIRVGGP